MGSLPADAPLPLYESLLELQNAADRIFDAIMNRVGLERGRLNNLLTRIASAQGKVDAISGTKRATTIYSSAKFPQVDTSVADFVPLFEGTRESGGNSSASTVSLNTGQSQSREEGTLELFQFFSETSHECWVKDRAQKDGIGNVLPQIKSVADLVLFNSTEVPYHKYRVIDNLAGVDQQVVEEVLQVKLVSLPAAPQSVLAGGELPRPGAEEYGFRPVLRPVPSFSLPSVLPDLPMVAEISWSGTAGGIDQLPSIAPSAVHVGTFSPRGNSSASPTFDSASASTKFDRASASEKLNSDLLSTRLDSAFSVSNRKEEIACRPQQPPQVNTTEERNIQTRRTRSYGHSSDSSSSSGSFLNLQSSKVDTGRLDSPIPPPPPAPIPPQSLRSRLRKINQVASNSSAQQPLPAIDGQRAALMSSIRSSGISLLRKTGREGSLNASPEPFGNPKIGRTEPEVLDDVSSPVVKKPINVMAEMARSLTLRRLSMRGASQSQGGVQSNTHFPEIDEEDHNSGSGDQSGKLALPSLMRQKSDNQSDDDDWEE